MTLLINNSSDLKNNFAEKADTLFQQLIIGLGSGDVKICKPASTIANREMQFGMHFHAEPEISIVLSGQLLFQAPNEDLVLNPGDICIIPAGVPHVEEVVGNDNFLGFVITEQARLITMHFAEAIGNRLQPQNIGTHNYRLEKSLSEYIVQAMKWLDDPKLSIGATYILQTYFHSCRELISKSNETGQINSPKIGRCIQLASEYISDPKLSVAMLSSWLGCNADYLSNLFHKETGMRLKEWIVSQRILLIRELLEDSSMTISEITISSGFNSSAYMRKVFREKTGYSPSSYRRYYFKA